MIGGKFVKILLIIMILSSLINNSSNYTDPNKEYILVEQNKRDPLILKDSYEHSNNLNLQSSISLQSIIPIITLAAVSDNLVISGLVDLSFSINSATLSDPDLIKYTRVSINDQILLSTSFAEASAEKSISLYWNSYEGYDNLPDAPVTLEIVVQTNNNIYHTYTYTLILINVPNFDINYANNTYINAYPSIVVDMINNIKTEVKISILINENYIILASGINNTALDLDLSTLVEGPITLQVQSFWDFGTTEKQYNFTLDKTNPSNSMIHNIPTASTILQIDYSSTDNYVVSENIIKIQDNNNVDVKVWILAEISGSVTYDLANLSNENYKILYFTSDLAGNTETKIFDLPVFLTPEISVSGISSRYMDIFTFWSNVSIVSSTSIVSIKQEISQDATLLISELDSTPNDLIFFVFFNINSFDDGVYTLSVTVENDIGRISTISYELIIFKSIFISNIELTKSNIILYVDQHIDYNFELDSYFDISSISLDLNGTDIPVEIKSDGTQKYIEGTINVGTLFGMGKYDVILSLNVENSIGKIDTFRITYTYDDKINDLVISISESRDYFRDTLIIELVYDFTDIVSVYTIFTLQESIEVQYILLLTGVVITLNIGSLEGEYDMYLSIELNYGSIFTSNILQIKVDNIPPRITTTKNSFDLIYDDISSKELALSVSDEYSGIDKIVMEIGDEIQVYNVTGNSVTQKFKIDFVSDNIILTVSITVTDNAGNEFTSSITVTQLAPPSVKIIGEPTIDGGEKLNIELELTGRDLKKLEIFLEGQQIGNVELKSGPQTLDIHTIYQLIGIHDKTELSILIVITDKTDLEDRLETSVHIINTDEAPLSINFISAIVIFNFLVILRKRKEAI